MAILKIARMGHPVLRKKTRPLEPSEIKSDSIQKLIDDMLETMAEYRGIGLAAPQVHSGARLFVAGLITDGKDDDEQDEPEMKVVTVINPEIKPVGSETSEDWEGCLSIPDIRGRVVRPRRVRVRGLDRRGHRMEFDLRDYAARVMQHEADHLDGVLFIDRMDRLESLTFVEELERYCRAEREMTER
jgi:peptide deformylase